MAFVPGTAFFADGTGKKTARMNFSYCNEATIEEGVRRLGVAVKRMLVTVSRGARA